MDPHELFPEVADSPIVTKDEEKYGKKPRRTGVAGVGLNEVSKIFTLQANASDAALDDLVRRLGVLYRGGSGEEVL